METIFDKPLDADVAANSQAIANMNISAISSSTTIASLCSSCPAGQHRYYFISDSNTLTDYPSTTRLYRVLLSIHKIDGSNNRADIEIIGKTGSDEPWMFVGIYENGTMYWSRLASADKLTQVKSVAFNYQSSYRYTSTLSGEIAIACLNADYVLYGGEGNWYKIGTVGGSLITTTPMTLTCVVIKY